MVIWTGTDNPAYNRAIFEIETTKSDIIKMEAELRRLNEARANAQQLAEMYDANLELLQKYAKVVSIREYTQLKAQRAFEYSNFIFIKNQIPTLERQIDAFKDGLVRLTASLGMYESKVLEFRRRD